MAIVRPAKKTSIRESLERLTAIGQVLDHTSIPFRDADYNTVLKARQVYQEKNKAYRFSVTKDTKNSCTIITRIE